MTGPVIAAIVTGFFSMIVGIIAAVLSFRAQRRTAQVDQAAAVFASYDALVKNLEVDRARLAEEIDEYVERMRVAIEALEGCEGKCRECQEKVGDLLANVASLSAIVTDEIARAAAGTVLDEHDQVAEAAELERIKHFLKTLREENPRSSRP